MSGNVVDGWRGVMWKGAGALLAGPVMAGVLLALAFADDGRGKSSPDPGGQDPGAKAGVELFLEAGAESARPGEEFDVRTTVASVEDVEGALLAQHVPEGLEIVEAGDGGVVREGIVNWRVAVPAGGEETFTVRVRVPDDGGRERVTSTACLLLQREAEPVACASDAVDPAGATVMSRVSEYMSPVGLLRAAGVLLVAALGWVLLRRGGVLRRG